MHLKTQKYKYGIKLHSVVCYSPINGHRITRVIQFVCNPVDINRTITHNRIHTLARI